MDYAAAVEAASMRPGQSCPGVVHDLLAITVQAADASMRPGQSCPGVGFSSVARHYERRAALQ